MLVAELKDGQSVDLNVQKNRVVLSVGDDDRVEYDFDTETQAYDAADEYCSVLQDFLGLVSSYTAKMRSASSPVDSDHNLYVESSHDK